MKRILSLLVISAVLLTNTGLYAQDESAMEEVMQEEVMVEELFKNAGNDRFVDVTKEAYERFK